MTDTAPAFPAVAGELADVVLLHRSGPRRSTVPGASPQLVSTNAEDLVDHEFIRELGYREDSNIMWLDVSHPALQRVACTSCDISLLRQAATKDSMCSTCHKQWKADGEQAKETYRAVDRRSANLAEPGNCLICHEDPHRRPALAYSPLCISHEKAMNKLGLTLEQLLASGSAAPLPSLGTCDVGPCSRLGARRLGGHGGHPLCEFHFQQGTSYVRRKGSIDDFLAGARSVEVAAQLRLPHYDFTDVPELVKTQCLALLTLGLRDDRVTAPRVIQLILDVTREHNLTDLLAVQDWGALWGRHSSVGNQMVGSAIRGLVRLLHRGTASVEAEMLKDSWDMSVFGVNKGGYLHFNGSPATTWQGGRKHTPIPPIRQTWLRNAAKKRAWELIARQKSVSVLRGMVQAVAQFSVTLAQREDGGDDPTRLGRADIVRHMDRLNSLERSGAMANSTHVQSFYALKALFDVVNEEPEVWRAPGEPFEQVPTSCRFIKTDTVRAERREAEDERAGQSLPVFVMRQLLTPESLAVLRHFGGEDVVRAVRIHAETGRRTTELVSLAWDCLVPVYGKKDGIEVVVRYDLRYTDFKNGVVDRTLPVHPAVVDLIREQQEHVRSRFPDTPVTELSLFPRPSRNRRGTVPTSANWLTLPWERWVSQFGADDAADAASLKQDARLRRSARPADVDLRLPPLLSPDVDSNGEHLLFDKEKVDPYSFRHTYAQRHADAGTDPDVLRRLMSHKDLRTTQGYYQVSRARMRQAVDALAHLQIDAHGEPVPVDIIDRLDSQVDWLSLGGLSVSYGTCFEPTNVRAGGKSCPFAQQCLGCAHFRTDPSHLHELRYYLQRRLDDAEMLSLAVESGTVSEWAAAKAQPDPNELKALRTLIERCEAALKTLAPPQRAQLTALLDSMEEARRSVDEAMPDELRHGVGNPYATHVHIPQQTTGDE